jgi:hypothetical protein
MVRRRVSAVSNHEARGPSFETPLRGSSSNNGEAVIAGMRAEGVATGLAPKLF